MVDDFQTRLRSAMERAGMTAPVLASALGVTQQAIRKLLDGGSRGMSAANCFRAAAVLTVDTRWLATGEGSMTAAPVPARPLDLAAALPVVLDAIQDSPARDELRQLLPLVVTGAPAYRQRVAELLAPTVQRTLASTPQFETRDIIPTPAPKP